MTPGEIAYLAMVVAAMVAFMGALMWAQRR